MSVAAQKYVHSGEAHPLVPVDERVVLNEME
jgi:hypothetical protein